MQGPASSFAGRRAVLATMHGKERAIVPAFRDILGIDIEVPGNLDTDQLGTFSGEVERAGTMDEVLVAKAKLGLKMSGLDLAIASEGSFGPHPQMPFIPVGLKTRADRLENRSRRDGTQRRSGSLLRELGNQTHDRYCRSDPSDRISRSGDDRATKQRPWSYRSKGRADFRKPGSGDRAAARFRAMAQPSFRPTCAPTSIPKDDVHSVAREEIG